LKSVERYVIVALHVTLYDPELIASGVSNVVVQRNALNCFLKPAEFGAWNKSGGTFSLREQVMIAAVVTRKYQRQFTIACTCCEREHGNSI